jgi:hypothetical protein
MSSRSSCSWRRTRWWRDRAIPYDVPGAELMYVGPLCSFRNATEGVPYRGRGSGRRYQRQPGSRRQPDLEFLEIGVGEGNKGEGWRIYTLVVLWPL